MKVAIGPRDKAAGWVWLWETYIFNRKLWIQRGCKVPPELEWAREKRPDLFRVETNASNG